jgi:hypothetical protein
MRFGMRQIASEVTAKHPLEHRLAEVCCFRMGLPSLVEHAGRLSTEDGEEDPTMINSLIKAVFIPYPLAIGYSSTGPCARAWRG